MHYVAHMVQEKQCRSYMKVLNKRAPLLGDRFYNTRLSRAITNGEASKMGSTGREDYVARAVQD